MSSYHPNKVWSIHQHVESHCDLDLWPIGLKINRDHVHSNTNVCAKFEESRSILCLVIIRTRFGLYQYMYVDGHCDLDLYLIDLTINSDHLHSKTHVCAKWDKPRSILCLVIIQTRFGIYVNMLKVTLTLTFNRLTSKSIGIIYTPRRMSVSNSRNLGQFCVYLSTGQGLVCINMLMVTVTLTLHRLTSKSIWIFYTPRCVSVPNLTNLD